MTRSALAAVAVLAVGAGLTAGCTSDEPKPRTPPDRAGPPAAGSFRLTSFRDCADVLDGFRTAARANLAAWGPYGGRFADDRAAAGTSADRAAAGGAPKAPGAVPPGAAGAGPQSATAPDRGSSGYSGTNTHEAGVDEPDLVKTDGKRIITVHGGVVRVIDAARRAEVGRLDLSAGQNDPMRYAPGELLLAGDKLLLISEAPGYHADDAPGKFDARPVPDSPPPPQLTLIDLAGTPRVVSKFQISGGVVDARQVGATARVVIRSAPTLRRPPFRGNPAQYTAALTEAIDRSSIEEWLPQYTVETDGRRSTGRLDCSAVARPAQYTAANLLTVLTFDLGRNELGNGDPVSIAADGDTVYSNGPSLYVANDQRWRNAATPDAPQRAVFAQRTEVYKFDTSKPGKPAFVAGGAVDGWLLNQYAMSEWNGHLRVATTSNTAGDPRGAASQSTVYVLRQQGKELVETGKVGGLGKGERIYSVRFVGGTGYVVTFRQTDPLYTLDLRDARAPKVAGELKITGYSAYLHPAGDGRLIGIGQEATAEGRTQGTQISLFDVSDPAAPKRLAQYHVKYGHSEAEFDPHAFLYWAQTGLLVVPLQSYRVDDPASTMGALALQVRDGSIAELGKLSHPGNGHDQRTMIRRSLVIDGTLWTVSQAGLLASDVRSAAKQAWVPFS